MNTIGRRADLSPDEAVVYSPVAPLAVAAIGIAGLSAVGIAGMWLASRSSNKPIFEPALLLAPLIACILGFVSYRQVRGADGTKSGGRLAIIACWLAGLTILIYGAYLFAVDLAIRNQSAQFTQQWLEKVATEPTESSFLLSLEPATRQSLDEKDTAGINERFSTEMAMYRNNEMIRMIQRCGPNRDAKLKSIRDWSLADGGYLVNQVFEYRCPEGKFDVLLPTYGRDTPALGGRTWQVTVRKSGLASRETTAYGRLLLDVQAESRKHLMEWGQSINTDQMHGAFLETLPFAQRPQFKDRNDSAEEKQFLAGVLIEVDGKPPTDEQRKLYGTELLRSQGLNLFPGSIQVPVGAPLPVFSADALRLRHHVELRMQETGTPVVVYIDVEVQGDDLVAEMLKLRNDQDWKNQPVAADRPGLQESDRFPKRGFRVVKVNVRPTEKRLPQQGATGRQN